MQCEGSTGPVDLFADSGGFFHTHLLARLSLSAHATRSKVAISARDAGDPVAGAAIAVGGRHLRTRCARRCLANAASRLLRGERRGRRLRAHLDPVLGPMSGRAALLAILAAPLVLAVGAAGSPAKAQSVFCGETITQSVKLIADLDCPSGVGLVAGVAHITIDLGGHTITGNTSSAGIVDSGNGQITVKNGSIAGFFIDVALSNAPGSTITGVVARGALQGGIEIGTSDATPTSSPRTRSRPAMHRRSS